MGLCEEILKEFDKRIVALFDEAIDKRVEEIAEKRGDKGRREEVANALRIDIRGLAGGMEHGMHVDVRYLQSPAIDGEPPAQEDAFQTLGEIQKKWPTAIRTMPHLARSSLDIAGGVRVAGDQDILLGVNSIAARQQTTSVATSGPLAA